MICVVDVESYERRVWRFLARLFHSDFSEGWARCQVHLNGRRNKSGIKTCVLVFLPMGELNRQRNMIVNKIDLY